MRELEVLEAGALTTVQDFGRPGYAHLGVPRSGALDWAAHRLANRLVGNPEDAATLETTMSGVCLRVEEAVSLAVGGAPCLVSVEQRERPWGELLSVPAGAQVRVGPAISGVRSYVAVAGGIDVEPVLGSRATDRLTGLGPPSVRSGDRLRIGVPVGEPAAIDAPATFRPVHTVRLRLGPRDDWFEPASVGSIDGRTYVVGSESNRIGLRLVGEPLERSRTEELPSEGMVLGAVQVLSNGHLVVLLADHPTTGGYPVVGVVEPADLDGCGQLRSGERVTLRLVG
ncbi:MAG: biotin-dependent carboxyltransferase family protein [Actinomycetota bacterium]|nr:biotin-dependent carboxyltransferase family protein [Actinomycetota bacterium]